ncbi:MAG: nuclear transport factor 2 family protein [Candidatus Aminicenantes bacterium]|nr:nuclear transport factor 2 family protein [Candidatus Aminicenantes bacterium]
MKQRRRKIGRPIFILLAAVSLAATFPQDPTPFLGDWKGTIERGAKIELVFHFYLGAEKQFAGAIDIPASSVFGDAVADLKVEGKTISFSLPNGASVKGALDESGNSLAMIWSRNGQDTNFTLTKTAAGGDYSPRLSAAEARKVIADGNREWGKARVALDQPTFERMLAPDFYVLVQRRKVSRQDFISNISASAPGAKLTRFDATVLTVQPTDYGWVALIHEKLEIERTEGDREKSYSLWITRDGWKKVDGRWMIAFSEAIGSEQWRNVKPPFIDW